MAWVNNGLLKNISWATTIQCVCFLLLCRQYYTIAGLYASSFFQRGSSDFCTRLYSNLHMSFPALNSSGRKKATLYALGSAASFHRPSQAQKILVNEAALFLRKKVLKKHFFTFIVNRYSSSFDSNSIRNELPSIRAPLYGTIWGIGFFFFFCAVMSERVGVPARSRPDTDVLALFASRI